MDNPIHARPARLKRPACCAQARAAAEAAANAAAPKKVETAAVEAGNTVDTTEATFQAVVNTSNVAVQADTCPPQPSDDSSAEQAGRQHSQLEHQVYPPLAAQAAHARPQQVRDEFCLDDYYKLLQGQSRSK